MDHIRNSLPLVTEVVTKEFYRLLTWPHDRHKANHCHHCKISCCICIRTLSSRNRMTTDQKCRVEGYRSTQVLQRVRSLGCQSSSRPSLRLEGDSCC